MVNFIAACNVNIAAADFSAVINRNNSIGIKIGIVYSCANAGSSTAAGICQRHSVKPAKAYVFHVIFGIKFNFAVSINNGITADFNLAYGVNGVDHNGACTINCRRMMPGNRTRIAAAALRSAGSRKIAVAVGVSKSKRACQQIAGALNSSFSISRNFAAAVVKHGI